MGHKLRLHAVVEESIVDGPGLRFVVFMQGCPHHCQGCHNPATHAPDGGYLATTDDVLRSFTANPLLAGMTLSGGEPLLQPQAALALAKAVKAQGKTLLIYTGYRLEDLAERSMHDDTLKHLLTLTDILIDGPYDASLHSLNLEFRGSSNQRILSRQDILASLERAVSAA